MGPLVEDIKKRACAKVWSLVKMREAGASTQQLATVYTAYARNGIEYGAQAYGCLLNASQSEELEPLQTKCCQFVLGANSQSYEKNLVKLNLPRLSSCRQEFMKDFAIACFCSGLHRWWFGPNINNRCNTRDDLPRFHVPLLKLSRSEKRPFVKYAQILNEVSAN